MLKEYHMELVQETESQKLWLPISEQSIAKSQQELDNFKKLLDLGASLRDDQFLRMNELIEFFADKTEKTLHY